jgi:hypothetical protein
MGDDIWNIMFAYDTWVSSTQLYASRWEVQYQVGELFNFKFELAIKGVLITSVDQLLRKKTELWTWLLITY